MPVIKFTARKMSEAKVSHISLVERGANRIPFRIIKEEKQDMSKSFAGIDLGNLLSRKKEDSKPVVVGVVTMKGETLEGVKAKISEAGFSVDTMEESEDGSVVFKQGDFEGEVSVVRLNDHIALVTKGFRPYNMDITADGVSFADVCSAQGFYPGIRSIMDVLASSVTQTVSNSTSPANAKAQVSKLFSEAASYVATFLSSLPEKAFKLEDFDIPAPVEAAKDEVTEPEAPADKSPAEVPVAEAPAEPAEEAVEKACKKPEDKKPDDEMSDDEMSDEEKAKAKTKAKKDEVTEPAPVVQDALTSDEVSAIVGTEVSKAMTGFADSLKTLADTMQAVVKSVEGINSRVDEAVAKVDEAAQIATATQEQLAGTVVIGSESGDAPPAQTQKSEMGSVGRDIDTAFMPRRKFPGR